MTDKTELQLLKERADKVGFDYPKNVTAKKLAADLNDFLAVPEDETPEEKVPAKTRMELRDEARKLVRIVLTPMDPTKRELPGDIFGAGNRVVGRFKRYIPFNNENGWHVEQILVNMLRDKKVQVFRDEKNAKGIKVRTSKLVAAYAITELPPLTEEEVAALAKAQQVRENA